MCQKFITQEPLKKIIVHCTHGFNRSGFLICAFLVESKDWSIDASVAEFSQRRPPGIYKGHYLEELFIRYGDIDDCPGPPKLPEWCFEDDDNSAAINGPDGDDDGPNSYSGTNYRFFGNRKNDVKAAKFMTGIAGVTNADPAKTAFVQKKCAEYCNWKGKGFPGAQPVSMDQKNIAFLFKKPYKVSWKADGTRYLMLIDGENEIYFVDRDNAVFNAKGIRFPRRKSLHDHLKDTLVDGEMIIDEYDGKKIPRFLIYDIIRFENQEVGGCDFNRRMQCIKFEIIDSREEAKKSGIIDREKEPFGIRAKDFWEITHTKSLLSPTFSTKLGHEIDGLIFQPESDPYKPGQCPDVLKWKPLSHNSIDFRLQIVREERPGMLAERKGYLYVNRFDQPIAMIKYTKELNGLDKKIIECNFDYKANEWKFMRQRTDKSFPNSYETAMAVLESIKNPVTKELLLTTIDQLEVIIREQRKRQHHHPPHHNSQKSPSSQIHQNSHKRPHPDGHGSDLQSVNNDRNLMPPPSAMRKVA